MVTTKGCESVDYRHLFVDLDGRVWFIYMKLQNDGDMRTMFYIFVQYCSKGPIKIDITLLRCYSDKFDSS